MPDNNRAVNLLVISSNEEDHAFFRRILGDRPWTVRCAWTVLEAWTTLHSTEIDVVMVDCETDGALSGRYVLNEVEELGGLKPVVMMSRLADGKLWAEVLNLGGYDLLSKPFDVEETVRVLTMAARHCLARDTAEVA